MTPVTIVTGGLGFLGSHMIEKLNAEGISNILVVDTLAAPDQRQYLNQAKFTAYMNKDVFIEYIKKDALPYSVDTIIHLGACSSTTEQDMDFLLSNNTHYTQILAQWTIENSCRFIYASSAATYGNGEHGFSDDESTLHLLKPTNLYGLSKHKFDLWAQKNGLLNQFQT